MRDGATILSHKVLIASTWPADPSVIWLRLLLIRATRARTRLQADESQTRYLDGALFERGAAVLGLPATLSSRAKAVANRRFDCPCAF
jgi:hypothetical protein